MNPATAIERLRTAGLTEQAIGAAVGLPAPGRAQGVYPDRPIRMLIGFAAGGPTDIVGRRFADRLGAVLGQPVVVENRSGASGSIASVEVMGMGPVRSTSWAWPVSLSTSKVSGTIL